MFLLTDNNPSVTSFLKRSVLECPLTAQNLMHSFDINLNIYVRMNKNISFRDVLEHITSIE